jgi:hypothetical protein
MERSQDLMRVQFDVGLVEALTHLKDIVLMPTLMPTGPIFPDIWRTSKLFKSCEFGLDKSFYERLRH